MQPLLLSAMSAKSAPHCINSLLHDPSPLLHAVKEDCTYH